MKIVTLTRYDFPYKDQGTFGELEVLEDNKSLFKCYTVERPWLNNMRGQSCIPEGTYEMKHDRYNKGGYYAYEIVGVPDRSEIKIHKANWAWQLEGCIGLGEGIVFMQNQLSVTKSANTLTEFMKVMNKEEGTIIIK